MDIYNAIINRYVSILFFLSTVTKIFSGFPPDVNKLPFFHCRVVMKARCSYYIAFFVIKYDFSVLSSYFQCVLRVQEVM